MSNQINELLAKINSEGAARDRETYLNNGSVSLDVADEYLFQCLYNALQREHIFQEEKEKEMVAEYGNEVMNLDLGNIKYFLESLKNADPEEFAKCQESFNQ